MESGARNQQPLRCFRQKFMRFVQPIRSFVGVCLFHVHVFVQFVCFILCHTRVCSFQSDPYILASASSVKWNSISIVGYALAFNTTTTTTTSKSSCMNTIKWHWLRCKTIDLNHNSTCWNIKQNGNKETNEQTNEKKLQQTHSHTDTHTNVNLVHKQCKFDIFTGFNPNLWAWLPAASHIRYCTLQFTLYFSIHRIIIAPTIGSMCKIDGIYTNTRTGWKITTFNAFSLPTGVSAGIFSPRMIPTVPFPYTLPHRSISHTLCRPHCYSIIICHHPSKVLQAHLPLLQNVYGFKFFGTVFWRKKLVCVSSATNIQLIVFCTHPMEYGFKFCSLDFLSIIKQYSVCINF